MLVHPLAHSPTASEFPGVADLQKILAGQTIVSERSCSLGSSEYKVNYVQKETQIKQTNDIKYVWSLSILGMHDQKAQHKHIAI